MGYLAITIYRHVFCPLKPPLADWLICLHGVFLITHSRETYQPTIMIGELHDVSPLNPVLNPVKSPCSTGLPIKSH